MSEHKTNELNFEPAEDPWRRYQFREARKEAACWRCLACSTVCCAFTRWFKRSGI